MAPFGLIPVKYWCFLMEVFRKRSGPGKGLFRRYCATFQRLSQPQIILTLPQASLLGLDKFSGGTVFPKRFRVF